MAIYLTHLGSGVSLCRLSQRDSGNADLIAMRAQTIDI